MPSNLEEAIRELSTYYERALPLYHDTVQCLEEMKSEKKLSEDAMTVMFSPEEIEETGRALKRRPSVVFIGNRNCGKSAILNELLQGSYLPVHETPCTSRIVKISYSSGENAIRVVNKEGKVLRRSAQFSRKSKVVHDYTVVPDKQREDREELKATVEIKLNHPLLQSGIQLIDSPGRNENDALNEVVDGFFEDGSTPQVVYIVDGNEQLRSTDREAIRLLQDKCPHISFIFVCNKVDTSTAAKDYDDDEDDDEEEDGEAQKPDKQKIVFDQLQKYGFLPVDETLESCSKFHGISALNVREERRGTKKGREAITMFENFKKSLFKILEETLKRQTRQSVEKLLSMIMSFLGAVQKEGRRLLAEKEISERELKRAMENVKSLFTEVSSFITSEENVRSIVKCNLLRLEEKCLQAADDFHPKTTVSISRETEHPYDQFLGYMKGIILDQAFNALRCKVNTYLLATVGNLMQRMTRHFRTELNPSFDFVLNAMYLRNEEIEEQLEKEASRVLRNELSKALSEGLLFAAKRKSRIKVVDSKESRRSAVQAILSKFSNERVTKAICETCRASLLVKHNNVVRALTNPNLVPLIGSKSSMQQLKELGVLYSPKLKKLAMQILALSFWLRKERLVIGELLKPTKHGKIYSCTGWTDHLYDKSCAVKIIKEKEVEASYWQQTASDLIHCWVIQKTSVQRPQNLLILYGWLTPKPGTLYVVMEKTKVDLTTALRAGLPLKKRAKIAMDVAHGICEIHQANYIAQDIKADSILIAKDDTAKINLAKPRKPFERTSQGTPFHISKEMYAHYTSGSYSHGDASYDIYAFGMLLWVLCEGFGARRPEVYQNYNTTEAMKIAVERDLFPERPQDTPEAWWNLMTTCWENRLFLTSDDVLAGMKAIFEES